MILRSIGEYKTFDAVTEEVVQAEAERAYLQDDSIRPEIPQDLEEKFHEITKLYDDYAKAANLDEKDIEKDNEKLEKAFVFAFKAHRHQKRKTSLISRTLLQSP